METCASQNLGSWDAYVAIPYKFIGMVEGQVGSQAGGGVYIPVPQVDGISNLKIGQLLKDMFCYVWPSLGRPGGQTLPACSNNV